MKLWTRSVTALVLLGIVMHPTSATAANLPKSEPKVHSEVRSYSLTQTSDSSTRFTKVLADHPGSATALTRKQKSEIKEILAKSKAKAKGKGNRSLVCTGLTLAGQRKSMYPLVRLRAQLVCDYAKSIDPALKITVEEKLTTERNRNGRVEVVSR